MPRSPLPAELRDQLQDALPRWHGEAAAVQVTPRTRDERECPAYAVHHYEVRAFYTTTNPTALDRLQQALCDLPGVYLTTQVRQVQGRNEVTTPDWPVRLGTSRRGFRDLRPQVLALIYMSGETAGQEGQS